MKTATNFVFNCMKYSLFTYQLLEEYSLLNTQLQSIIIVGRQR